MASNAIASGAAILTANADGLVAGLRKSEKDIQDWGGRVQTKLAKPGAGKGGAAGAGGGGAGLLGLGKAGGVAAGFAIAGVAAGKFGMEVKETLDDLNKMNMMAGALGLTAEQFTGIAGVAKSVGEDTREFVESLVTMGKLGSDAANGVGEIAAPAFKKLGINAKEFIKLRADEQFFQIFESLNKLGPGLDRTRLIMNTFGEDGGKWLLPLLSKTPEELRKMAQGFAVSAEGMKKAAAASQAMKSMQATAGKLWQNAAIMLAPLVEGVANVANKIMNFLKPAFEWYGRYVSTVLTLGAAVWDAVATAIGGVVDWFVKLNQEAFGFVGEMPTIQDVVVNVFRYMGLAAAYAWDVVKAGAGVAAVAIGKIVGFVGDLADRFKGTFKSIAETGADVASALGLTDTEKMFRRIGAATDKIGDSIRGGGKAMEDWGKGAMNGIGSSADQFNKWLDNALKPQAKKAGTEVAQGLADGLAEAAPAKLSGALLAGSKEAYSLILKNQLRGFASQDEPIKQVVKEAKKGNDLQKKNNADVGKIAEAMAGIGVF